MFRRGVSGTILVLVMVLLPATAATAQTYVGVTPPQVGGRLTGPGGGASSAPAAVQPQVVRSQVIASQPAHVAKAPVRGLAVTGADLLLLVLLAVPLILLGLAITRGARARVPQA